VTAAAGARLPGVRIDVGATPLASPLPRMDVAGFVGLASAGPVDVPVPVEDADRFADLFGDAPALAWDAARGEMRRARLAGAVRAFFRNGGRRCWVVRAAGDGVATGAWTLPGLLGVRPGAPPDAAVAVARAPGSWADGVTVNAAVTRRPLRGAVVPEELARPDGGADRGWRAAGVAAGELVELRAGDVVAYAVATDDDRTRAGAFLRAAGLLRFRRAPRDASLAALGAADVALLGAAGAWPLGGAAWDGEGADGWRARVPRARLGPGDPPHPGTWLRALPAGGAAGWPADARALLLLVDAVRDGAGGEVALVGRDAWWALGESADRPAGSVEARVVELELAARAAGRARRLGALGLAPGHPRFWGHLADDRTLFTPEDRPPAGPPPGAALRVEVDAPRFPLAAPADAARAAAYVPLGLTGVAREDFARPAAHDGRPAPERDGLATFDASLLLDPALRAHGEETLLAEAFALQYGPGAARPPRRLHALLGVEEVAIVAVPDAAHDAWAPGGGAPPPLAAPVLRLRRGEVPVDRRRDPARPEDAAGWRVVPGAVGYEVQSSPDPQLRAMVGAPDVVNDAGSEWLARVALVTTCAAAAYYRVRAVGTHGPGPWSNTLRVRPSGRTFAPCPDDALRAPRIRRARARGDRVELRWVGVPAFADDTFRLEESPDPTFAEARVVYEGAESGREIWRPEGAPAYYRVCARRGALVGPWSRTMVLPPAEAAARRLAIVPPRPGASPDPDAEAVEAEREAYAVHAALLRLCAARGDAVAVLHLPARHGERAARGYRARLLAAAARDAAASPLGDRALSFGMLAHPWPVSRPLSAGAAPSVAAPLGAEPPDGVLCGLLAARALGRGAWTSAANLPAADVVALAPRVRDPSPDPYVNWLRETARGFVTLGDDTLSDDPELRELHVRRLLALLRRLAAREGAVYAFQPHDESLRRLVRRQFERALGELFARGAFAGRAHDEAYRVVADASVNPAPSVDLGRLVVELRVAPARALAFLTVRLVEAGGAFRVEGA
jgi:hypothetical protein